MKRLGYLLVFALVISADYYSKQTVAREIPQHQWTTVVPGLLRIAHVQNSGAAFGIGGGAVTKYRGLVFGVSAAILLLVVTYSALSSSARVLLQTALHLIMGGAVGNLIDRVRYGSVLDFIDLFIRIDGTERHWWTFNLADIAICAGAGLLFVDILRTRGLRQLDATPVRSRD